MMARREAAPEKMMMKKKMATRAMVMDMGKIVF
jgi:hypothetical protein